MECSFRHLAICMRCHLYATQLIKIKQQSCQNVMQRMLVRWQEMQLMLLRLQENILIGSMITARIERLKMAQNNMQEMALSLCVCRNCPSYIECKEKIGFCFSGKSKCIAAESGCICGGCPVTNKMGLKHMYYCTKGSEKEQSGI